MEISRRWRFICCSSAYGIMSFTNTFNTVSSHSLTLLVYYNVMSLEPALHSLYPPSSSPTIGNKDANQPADLSRAECQFQQDSPVHFDCIRRTRPLFVSRACQHPPNSCSETACKARIERTTIPINGSCLPHEPLLKSLQHYIDDLKKLAFFEGYLAERRQRSPRLE